MSIGSVGVSSDEGAWGLGLVGRTVLYGKPYLGLFIGSVALSLCLTAGDLLLPYLVKLAIDRCLLPWGAAAASASMAGPAIAAIDDSALARFLSGGAQAGADAMMLARFCLFSVATIALMALGGYLHGLMLARAGQGVVRDIRNRLYAHVVQRHLSFFHRTPVGKLVTRLTNDVEAISEFFTLVLSTTVKDVLLIGGIVAIIWHLNGRLTLSVMTMVPLLVTVTLIFRHHAVRSFRQIRNRLAELNAFVAETLSGIRIVKLMRREPQNDRRFRELSHRAYLANVESIRLYAIFQPFINVLNLLAVGLVLWLGGRDVLAGRMTVGTLVAFVSYVQMLFAPVTDLAEKYNLFQSAMAGAEKVQALFDVTEQLPVSAQPHHPAAVRGALQVDGVSFRYGADGPDVLHNVSLRAEPGEVVALVGHSGAGKSTLISLLLRLYDAREGRVLLDGVDLRAWGASALRRSTALVPQDVVLFSESVRENLRLWDPAIGDERLWAALRAVQAEHFVRRLPGGLDAVLAERGQTLSAGQRQLLAFARALAQEPRVVIMDEATSSIDPGTERMIQEATEALWRERTVIVIAHRLTTIRRADRIAVLHQGRVVETGSHAELLARRDYYYALYRTQFSPAAA